MVVKTHTFNGRKYKIDVDILDGQCDQYNTTNTLQILTSLSTRKGLITVIHEALHAECWTASEETVERVSREVGSFLWRLGYRRVDNGISGS